MLPQRLPVLQIVNNSASTGAYALNITTTANLNDYLLNVDATGGGDNTRAAAFKSASSSVPTFFVENQGTYYSIYATNSGGGTVAYFENDASANTPVIEIVNNSTNSGAYGLNIVSNANLDDYLLNVDASFGSNTRAAAFKNNSFQYPTVYIANNGGDAALNIDNSGASTPGLAIKVEDGGGAVKLSYAADNTANPTVPNGVSVFYASANSTSITLPTSGVNGQFLYIIYTGTTNCNIGGGLYTTNGAASVTLVYAGGAWQVVSAVE